MQKQSNTGIYLIGAGIAAALLYKGFIRPNVVAPLQLKAYTTRLVVRLKNPTVKDNYVGFDLEIENPNNTPMTIRAVVGDLFLDTAGKTYKLGNVARYGDVVIRPVNSTNYNFRVQLRAVQLINYFTDLVKGRVKGQTARFVGTINIDGRPWPITERVKIA